MTTAVSDSPFFIEQEYDNYSPEQHATWDRLFARMRPRWERFANDQYLRGVESLYLDPKRIPKLEEVNEFLSARTGFRAKAVSGYMPAFHFFDCLRTREFPTTVTIRDGARLDYLPEPDIFHDIAGHVPMHTDPAFAAALVQFGGCAQRAAELVRHISDPAMRAERLTSMLRAMTRFFWFTIEFGLMQSRNGLKVYGSGLLSSYGEIEHAIVSDEVQRYPIQFEWVVNQGFAIDRYQPLLFVVEGFDQLFDLVNELERWMKAGKLNHVAVGDPEIRESELTAFGTN